MSFSETMSRRAAIAQLLGIPLALLSLERYSLANSVEAEGLWEEDPFALYEDMLIMGRACLNNGGPLVSSRIHERLKKLVVVTQNASLGEKERWLSLLCRYYQLSSSFAHHDTEQAQALSMATYAIDTALELGDIELLACSFFRRCRIYLDQSTLATPQTQQRSLALARADIDAALSYAKRVRIPLQGNIYLLAAEVYAWYTENDPSLHVQIEQWQDNVAQLASQHPLEDDGTFLHLNLLAFHHEKAKTLLHFGRLSEARGELTKAWKALQPNPLTWHGNMHLTEAKLYQAERDIEGSATSGMEAYAVAKALPSRKIKEGARLLFQELQQLDEQNPHVRDFGLALGRV